MTGRNYVRLSDGKGGLKKMHRRLLYCSRTKEGSFLSLDGLEEAGYSVEDRAQDVAEIVAGKMLLEELFKVLGRARSQQSNGSVDCLWRDIRSEKLRESCQFRSQALSINSKADGVFKEVGLESFI